MPYVNSANNTQMMCNVFSYFYFYQRNGFKNTSKGHCCLMVNILKITIEIIMCNDKIALFWVIYTTLN